MRLIKPVIFLILTTGLMFGVLYAIETGSLPEAAVLIGLFGPALFAVVFTAKDGGAAVGALLRQYIKVRAHLHIYLIAMLLVPSLLLITQQLTGMTGIVDYTQRYAMLGAAQLIFIPLISIGEELGWRGYLQPLFRQHYSFTVASLLVGVCWALWHLPGYFYSMGVVDGVSFIWFGLWVTAGSVIIGYLYEHTASVFVAIVFHTVTNFSFNVILIMPSTTGTDIPFKILVCLAAGTALILAWQAESNKAA